MKKQANIRMRYNLITTIVYIVGIILLVQLFNLQIVHGEEYRQTSNTRLTRETVLKAARGTISERNGNAIVETTMGFSLELYKSKIDTETLNNSILNMIKVLEQNGDKYVDEFPVKVNPFEFISSDEEKIKKWKKSNNVDENATAEEVFYIFKNRYKIENENIEDARKIIATRYQISQEGYSSTKSIQISSNISRKSMLMLNELGDKFPGILVITEPIRSYPKGKLASHIVGYIGKIGTEEYKKEKDNGYTQNDYYGRAGIEYAFEKYLKGQDGIKQIDMAVDGTITGEYISKEAIAGSNVVLTIDANLQAVAEEALKNNVEKIKNGGFSKSYNATGGAIVVMEVKTGEILAMASYPDYEPSKFIGGIDSSTWNSYIDKISAPLKNRAIEEIYSPGSIFKMITAIAGLETNAITTTTKINDLGVYPYGHHPACWIWNSSKRTHGWLNVSGAIQHSCNYFFYEVGNRIGIDNIEKYASYFGLGRKTGIELPNEKVGLIRNKGEWYPGDTLSAAIGQKDNTYTPIQMAKYASMLANGGKNIKPTIIKTIINANGTEVPKEEIEEYVNKKLDISQDETEDLNINPDNLKAILEGMRSVTSESGGTAYAYFKNFNIEVGGKTGSAQTGKTDENGNKITNAWFLGFAPYDNPEIAVVVLVENGGSGSYTAEAARDVIKQYFGMNSNGVQEDSTALPNTEVQN